MADPYSIRQTAFAQYLPVIVHQGPSGVCAFASVIQFLKFRVGRRFNLMPAALNGWWTPEQLMFEMLALEGNPYGLVYNPHTGDCPASPLTVLRYIRDVGIPIPVPQGILRITSIDTYRTVDVENLNGIDGGEPDDHETELIGSLDGMWDYICQIISEGEAVLGEFTVVGAQFLEHTRQGIYIPRRRSGSRRIGSLFPHASMVTGHNHGVGGRRYLEIHNTWGSAWGGWNGYGKARLNMSERQS